MYSLDCVCGHHIEIECTMLVCPGCQRLVEIDWPALSREKCHELEQVSSHGRLEDDRVCALASQTGADSELRAIADQMILVNGNNDP
jgi:hypothetical protein